MRGRYRSRVSSPVGERPALYAPVARLDPRGADRLRFAPPLDA